jgi:hydrogenase/urease accessory protein HupE
MVIKALRPGRLFLALVFLTTLSVAPPAFAHPAPYSYVDVFLTDEGLTGRLVLHDMDVAHDLRLASVEELGTDAGVQRHADAIVRLLRDRFSLIANGEEAPWTAVSTTLVPDRTGVEIKWRAAADAPGHLRIVADLFPYDPDHQTFVNIYERSSLVHQAVLDRGRWEVQWYAGSRQGRLAVFRAFVLSGIHHIAIGPDHILFLIGLLLLGGSLRRLLAIVTAFTLGHSVTLALATLQLVTPPPGLVEPAIALSIIYVGADNLIARNRGRDVRPWVALFFGLVHGFGFASVLRETGLPERALGLSLFGFNLGVEIGQAAIVMVAASALMALRGQSPRAAARVATAGSVCVVLAGTFWFFERLV